MRFGASLEGTWVRSNFQGYARRAKPSPLLSACSHTAVLVTCAVATLGGWRGGRIFDDTVPLSRVAFGRCVAVGAQRNRARFSHMQRLVQGNKGSICTSGCEGRRRVHACSHRV